MEARCGHLELILISEGKVCVGGKVPVTNRVLLGEVCPLATHSLGLPGSVAERL